MAVWNKHAGRYEQAGQLYVPLNEPVTARQQSAADEEQLRQSAAKAAPRRILLLGGNAADAGVEAVLAEPAAHELHAVIRRLAELYPGRTLAAEWRSATGWTRWLIKVGANPNGAR